MTAPDRPAPLRAVTSGELPPGRYRLPIGANRAALRRHLAVAGWAGRFVNGAAMRDRVTMFDEFATALEFPGWFGHNWDAFADCLRDLSWLTPDGKPRNAGDLRGIAVLWPHAGSLADADPVTWHTAGEVIDGAIATRTAIGVAPLFVIYPA